MSTNYISSFAKINNTVHKIIRD